MGERMLIAEEHGFSSREVPSPTRSLSTHFSSLMIDVDGDRHRIVSRKSFSYDRLPSEPFRLSVLKLDGSCFHVEVGKSATVAELKQAVEAAFSYMPQKGPGKISWQYVWGQFCLWYEGQKLVTETNYLRDYGIKDGDQLRFIRHVSNTCSFHFHKKRLKKRVSNLKQHRRCRSSSQLNRYQQKEHCQDDDLDFDDIVIENGKILHYNEEEDCVGKNRLTGFLGGLYSYTRLAVVRRARAESRICPSTIAKGILGSFRNIRRMLCSSRRWQCSRRHTWRV